MRLLLSLLIMPVFAFATPAPKELQDSLREFVKMYKSSKTHRDLIRKMPTFSRSSERIHEKMLGPLMDKPLPRLDFDYAGGAMAFDGMKVRLVDAGAGKMLVDGREFTWQRQKSYYNNWLRLIEHAGARKTSALSDLSSRAFAQNRDFFPPTPASEEEPLLNNVDKAMLGGDAAAVASYAATKIGKPNALLSAGSKAGAIATVAYFGYYGVGALSTGVALAEGVFQPSCDDQLRELKELMNANKISLASAHCSWTGNRESNMNFYTPDGKELPFVANWETGTLTVDGNETYYFGWDSLSSVYTRDGKTISEGPKFEEYKKNLEAYRKVLFYIGSRKTCFKCGAAVERHLTVEHPRRYPVGAPGAPQPATTGQ